MGPSLRVAGELLDSLILKRTATRLSASAQQNQNA